MVRKIKYSKSKFIGLTALIMILILAGVGLFTYRLYVRIVDESKTLTWEMTVKTEEVLELRLEDIRESLRSFSQKISMQGILADQANQLVSYEMSTHPVFRLHIIGLDGVPLTTAYSMTPEEAVALANRCPEDGVFSKNYMGNSGRWQTAVAFAASIGNTPCRVYAECVLDDLYMDDFMEFHDGQGYCYLISGTDGDFIMLPHNQFGQGLYSGLFTMLQGYQSNDPAVIDEIRTALANRDACTVQMDFRGENCYFCFVPMTEQTDWFVVSVIPSAALEQNGMTAIYAIVLLGAALLLGVGLLLAMNHRRWKLRSEMEAAQLASQAKSGFLSNMSHEIRTPMNAIIGMTEIIKLNPSDLARIHTCVDKISVSSKYLLGIINDVLDMSKIESNKMTLECGPFSVSALVDSAVDLVQPLLQQRKHQFSVCAFWNGPECLIGDSMRISQVLVNILSNAVKYTPEGGQVRLRLFCEQVPEQKETVALRMEVEDTGIGMSKEYQKILFEPFSQEKNSLRKGTGLGMSIAAQLVHLMGGEIMVQSELGKGSLFCVSLSLPVAMEKKPDSILTDKMSVLLIHTDTESLKAAQYTLSVMGLSVSSATSAEEASTVLAQENKPDLVIVNSQFDAGLRDISDAAHQAGALFFLAGYGLLPAEKLEEAGAAGYLTEPLLPSKLLAAIGGKKAEQESDDSQTGTPLQGLHILLAEDNEMNAVIAIELLSHFGAEVERAIDGVKALQAFESSAVGRFNLILMDIQMPHKNGYDTARAIRKLDRPDAVKIPILAMTADAFSENIAMALEAGMNGHIAKPIEVSILLRKIKEATKREATDEK